MEAGMSTRVRLLTFLAVVVAALAASSTGFGRTHAVQAMQVTIDIRSQGSIEVASPANIAVRAGGKVTITIRNHTRLFHTFTMSRLGLSAIVRPATHGTAGVAKLTFIAPYGVYTWRCLLCDTPAHPHLHAMKGTVYAIVNA
jgi:uncharacterized cupredoxin-like copper-binding protein